MDFVCLHRLGVVYFFVKLSVDFATWPTMVVSNVINQPLYTLYLTLLTTEVLMTVSMRLYGSVVGHWPMWMEGRLTRRVSHRRGQTQAESQKARILQALCFKMSK
jgi:prepilin signal peptidase PulO-like enzyme (type II secretory pathway)